MRRRRPGQHAYTLIEVMVAATVLVVSFTGVIQAVMRGADMIDTARKQQIAMQIIEGEFTRLRSITWAGSPGQLGVVDMANSSVFRIWVNADGTVGYDPVGSLGVPAYFSLNSNSTLKSLSKGFTCQANTTNLRIWTSPKLLAVTYTVSWAGSSGQTHSRSMTGHFGENGLHLSFQK